MLFEYEMCIKSKIIIEVKKLILSDYRVAI